MMAMVGRIFKPVSLVVADIVDFPASLISLTKSQHPR
jgi:hypothetical protein